MAKNYYNFPIKYDSAYFKDQKSTPLKNIHLVQIIQARIAQLVAYRLGTGKVPGSNPGKGENFSVKISN